MHTFDQCCETEPDHDPDTLQTPFELISSNNKLKSSSASFCQIFTDGSGCNLALSAKKHQCQCEKGLLQMVDCDLRRWCGRRG